MKADGQREQLQRIAQSFVDAVGNGSAATSEANKAVTGMKVATDQLKNARVYAQQEVQGLRETTSLLRTFFEDAVSHEINDAISLLDIATQKVEDYIAYISQQIDDLENVALAAEGNTLNLMSSSGLQVKQASDAIISYAQRNL